MHADDRRRLLEAIALADDPDVRPADRLRALQELRELGLDYGVRHRRDGAQLTVLCGAAPVARL